MPVSGVGGDHRHLVPDGAAAGQGAAAMAEEQVGLGGGVAVAAGHGVAGQGGAEAGGAVAGEVELPAAGAAVAKERRAGERAREDGVAQVALRTLSASKCRTPPEPGNATKFSLAD